MERTAVQSRDLAIVGYDDKAGILEVAFRRGGVYRYQNVPADVYQALLNAPSHGTYFQANIKKKYPYQKVR